MFLMGRAILFSLRESAKGAFPMAVYFSTKICCLEFFKFSKGKMWKLYSYLNWHWQSITILFLAVFVRLPNGRMVTYVSLYHKTRLVCRKESVGRLGINISVTKMTPCRIQLPLMDEMETLIYSPIRLTDHQIISKVLSDR